MKLEAIEIQVTNEPEKKSLLFEESSMTGLYLTSTFIEPDKAFCIWVNTNLFHYGPQRLIH